MIAPAPFRGLALFAAILAAGAARAQDQLMPAAPAGVVEAGTPTFVVLTPGALGLSSPPTDIHVLPDGRVLVVAAQELALGDGVRWETLRRHPATDPVALGHVMVDTDGAIYASVGPAFARLEFVADGHWRFTRVAALPADPALGGRALVRAAAAQGEWYWSAGSGAIVAWRPGRPATVIGFTNDLDRPFVAGGATYFGDPATGAIHRATAERLETFDSAALRKVDRTITCGVTLPDGRAVVGTNNSGALVFDGRDFRPLATRGPFASGYRINDLCATAGDFFCAALDNLGLVFFDPAGHIVQVLDRTVDHRLARARRLLGTPDGTVWALLNEGVAQVEFPSRLSNFEPFVTTGLAYSQPTRHEGRLWLLADGQVHRGEYVDDRLVRFVVDHPGPWASTVLSTGRGLLVATSGGIFARAGDRWRLEIADVLNAHLGALPGETERWLMIAQDEVGWVRADAGRFTVERFAVPGMGSSYGSILYGEGAFWAELGTSRAARITITPDGGLATHLIGRADGFPDGWVQAFMIDGRVRFNVAGRTYRYDAAAARIVPDPDFLRQAPELLGENGRPARDARGRLWLTADDCVHVLDEGTGAGRVSQERMPAAFTPIAFTPETGGVVWMQQRQRLVRFDPAMPEAAPAPLRAVLTQIHLAASNRHLFQPGEALAPLDHRDHSLVAHFVAPHRGLGSPVTFEIRLEGGDNTWVSTGTAGSATLSQLQPGRYRLHVRPRTGPTTGTAATLAFEIRPPWYRTTTAYVGAGLGAILLVVAIAGGWAWWTRREQARLERIVAERTAELRRSEENHRRLNEELERRVELRTAELHQTNDRLVESNRELEAFSYSVSHDLRTPLRNIRGFSDLLQRRAAPQLDPESTRFLGIVAMEATRLGLLIDSLLTFSRLNRAELKREPVDLAALVAAVRADLAPETAGRRVDWRIGPLPVVAADPTLVRQVLANLLENALKFTRNRDPAVIEVGATAASPTGEHVVFVRDNGAGFDPRYGDKLFGVFQRLHSSRDYEGSGIGLATVRRIIARHGGRVWAEGSPDAGATFCFTLPPPPGEAPVKTSTTTRVP